MTLKHFIGACVGAALFVLPGTSWGGACDTNANALERSLNSRCASTQGAACRTCVEQQYNTLTRAVPASCKTLPDGAVIVRRQEWEAEHCQ